MKHFLFITGLLLLMAAIGLVFSAEFVTHQTFGAVVGVMGAVMMGSAAIVEAIHNIPRNEVIYTAQLNRKTKERQAKEDAAKQGWSKIET